MTTQDRRRRAFLAHLLVTSLLVSTGFVVVTAISLFVPVIMHLNDPTVTPGSRLGVAEHLLRLHGSFWPMVMFVLISCVVSSLLLYVRMTGPFVRFVRAFRAIERGEVPQPIEIRHGDYLREEQQALNSLLTALHARNDALHDACEAVRAALASGDSSAVAGPAKALVELAESRSESAR